MELIDRATTPIGLTPEGRLFRSTARTLIRQVEEGVSLLQGQNRMGSQALEFVAAHSLSTSLLPDLIRTMGEDGKVLRSRVESIDVDLAVEALQEGRSEFLLAFDIQALMQPPFQCISLGKSKLRPVCAPGEDGQPKFQHTSDAPIPLLSYSPGAYMGREVRSVLRNIQHQQTFTPLMESSLTNLLKVMAVQGDGVAWLPDYAISEELASGELTNFVDPVVHKEYLGEVEVFLYRNDARLRAGAERFWSSLKQRCQEGWTLR